MNIHKGKCRLMLVIYILLLLWCYTYVVVCDSNSDSDIIQIDIVNNNSVVYYVNTSLMQVTFDISIDNPISTYTVRFPNDDVIRLYNDEQRKMFRFINGYFISSLYSSSIIHNIVFQQDSTNIFALPYTPLNVSYSNVHQMRSCGLIKRNAFAIELNHNKSKQMLYIGGIPQYKRNEYPHKLNIHAEPHDQGEYKKHWSFNIHALRIGSKQRLHVVRKAKLSLINDFIVVDKDVYTWIKQTIMSNYINGGLCVEKEGYFTTFKCKSEVMKALPSLYIIVNGNKCVEIKLNEAASNGDVSIGWNKGIDGLGYIYVNRNVFYGKVIEFDYDDNTISIYTNLISSNYINDIRLLLTYTCCILTLINVIWLIITRVMLTYN